MAQGTVEKFERRKLTRPERDMAALFVMLADKALHTLVPPDFRPVVLQLLLEASDSADKLAVENGQMMSHDIIDQKLDAALPSFKSRAEAILDQEFLMRVR